MEQGRGRIVEWVWRIGWPAWALGWPSRRKPTLWVGLMPVVTVALVAQVVRETVLHGDEDHLLPTPAIVVASEVVPAPDHRGRRCRDPHELRVRYRWETERVTFEGARFARSEAHQVFCDGEDARSRRGELAPGTALEVHVDPAKSSEAIRQRRPAPLPWQIAASSHAVLLVVQHLLTLWRREPADGGSAVVPSQ